MNLVEIRGLSVAYGHQEVLSAVDLDIEMGDFVAVIGANGSGKTTLMRAMLGLADGCAGTVRVGGLPPAEAARTLAIGYLPQRSSWADPRFPATVREVVTSGLLARRRAFGIPAADRAAVERTLKLLNIEDIAEKRIGELSGGQQQRAHLARAMAPSPRLLVLDEPTGALDPGTRGCFYETLAALNKNEGTTIVVVSHDVEGVGPYARTIVLVDRGIAFVGTPTDYAARASEIRLRAEAHYFGAGHAHLHGQGACPDA